MNALREGDEIPDLSEAPQSSARVEALHEDIDLLPGQQELRYGDEAAGPRQFVYAGGLEHPPAGVLPNDLNNSEILDESNRDRDSDGSGLSEDSDDEAEVNYRLFAYITPSPSPSPEPLDR